MSISSEEVLAALNFRYATKRFDPQRKISESDWQFLQEATRLSPSSYGLQPWKFLVIRSPELRARLRQETWDQSQVVDCSHYVVFTALREVNERYIEKYLNSVAKNRGVSIDTLTGFRQMLKQNLLAADRRNVIQYWTQRQAYIAMGTLLTAAALRRIDACPIEGMDPAAYDRILGLNDYATVASVALGYRHPQDAYQNYPKSRFDLSEIFEERF